MNLVTPLPKSFGPPPRPCDTVSDCLKIAYSSQMSWNGRCKHVFIGTAVLQEFFKNSKAHRFFTVFPVNKCHK